VPPGVADALSRVKEGRDGLRGATGDGGSRWRGAWSGRRRVLWSPRAGLPQEFRHV